MSNSQELAPNKDGNRKSIGQGMVRKDGHAKVTGAAMYSGDWPDIAVAHGAIFQSTIASGEVDKIDTSLAAKVPGVIDIITADNAPKLKPLKLNSPVALGDPRVPLQDGKIYYNGQPLGVVVATTVEAAEQAARLVKIYYVPAKAKLNFEELRKTDAKIQKKDISGRTATASKGDIKAQLAKAQVTMQATYRTPIENHHPMETSSTLADWQGEHLKVYESTQGVANAADTLSKVFNLKKENVQVITKFVGGGFGCKGSLWTHGLIAVIASQVTKRPVKVAISRPQMGTNVGYRSLHSTRRYPGS